MGLCKCPKRKVTNQFCFEHRVNVCEHCMVTNHSKCIIQSYLQWLQDSDYNPICELCMKELNFEDCIRLTCYHVFHWSCLDNYSRQLPSTTAPAGYTCPSCRAALFPPGNLVSPVADVLREKLAGVNWARAGLGLPLLSDDRELKPTVNHHVSQPSPSISPGPPYSVVHVEEQSTFNRGESGDKYQVPAARRVFQDIRETRGVTFDHDEDKYKRRPASEWFKRMWKNAIGAHPRSRAGGSIYKRYCMLAIILVFAVAVIFLTISRLSKYASDNDPMWDIRQNPNLHFEQKDQRFNA